MKFYWKLVTIALDIGHIFEPSYKVPERGALLLAYIKIRTKASLNRFFHFPREHFLGFKVTIPDYDIFLAIFRQVFVRNVYYFQAPDAAPRIIDCGGNIGMSVLYWKYLYPASQVTVFEPSREVASVLRQNIEQNGLTGIRIVEAAVSDREGKATIYMRGAAACGNTLSSSINDASGKKGKLGAAETGYEVDTVKLSRFVDGRIDMMKMDIEGAEGVVCAELAASGAFAKINELAMEYHYYPREATNDLDKLLHTLKNVRFESQLYFEEYDPVQQLAFSQSGSYSAMLRATRVK